MTLRTSSIGISRLGFPVSLRRTWSSEALGLLAHDALQVAGVRVGVEGHPPRARSRGDASGVAACDGLLVDLLDLAGVLRDVDDRPDRRGEVATGAESFGHRRLRCEATHLLRQRARVAEREEEPVHLVLNELGHAADVRRHYRHARASSAS
ncbi:MAG: hypothetical protein U0353_27455 [Sandaracinus sp.]